MSPDNAEGTGEGAGPVAARELLIDRQLPRFEAHSFSALIVAADTEQTYRAVRALDPEQVAASVPFMRLMGQARALPARFAGIGQALPQILGRHRPVRGLHHAALADVGQAARRTPQLAIRSKCGGGLLAETCCRVNDPHTPQRGRVIGPAVWAG